MYYQEVISEKKLKKLVKKLKKSLDISSVEAYQIIYSEWDYIENLFLAHKKVKIVKDYLIRYFNEEEQKVA